eukprot:UN24567
MYLQREKYVKMSFFLDFTKFDLGMSSYQDEFIYVKIESLMFSEVFCTKNESFSFNIHEILDPQILHAFLQKICGIMTFGINFELKVILMGRVILRMCKG